MTTTSAIPNAIRGIVEGVIEGRVNVAARGTVVAYDPLTQRATVQLAARRRIPDPLTGTEIPSPTPFPPVPNLPVVFPFDVSGTVGVSVPVLPGTPVTVVFCDRSTDEYQATGSPVVPATDTRRWALSDGVVFLGARPLTAPLPATSWDALGVVVAGTPAAPVKLGTSAAVDAALKGTTFEASLSAFLSAQSAFVTAVGAAVAAPGNTDPGWAVLGPAVLAFSSSLTTFASLVASGVHQSTSVKVGL